MPSTSTDQIQGISTSVALKAPCKVATTANITLSGEQTVNSVAVVAGDRVLVKDQTTASENGIWVVSTSAWTRAKDFDGSRDVVTGTRVPVYSGSGNYSEYAVSNIGSIAPGTTSLTFVLLVTNIGSNISATSLTLSGGGTVGGALTVSGNTALNGGATLGDAAGDALLINSTAVSLGGNLNIDSGTLFIDRSNDRVGVGTTSPSVKLHVTGSANTEMLRLSDGTNTLKVGTESAGCFVDSSAGPIIFKTNATEWMRLSPNDSAGSLLLGTNAYLVQYALLQVKGNGLAAPGLFEVDGTSNTFQILFRNDNGTVGSISTNGAATAYNTSSDARLKEDPQPLDAGAIIDGLRMYRFKWRGDGSFGYGGYAQEMAEVFPPMVTPGKGEPGDKEFQPWGVDYSVVVPLLIAEVQALRKRVAALESA